MTNYCGKLKIFVAILQNSFLGELYGENTTNVGSFLRLKWQHWKCKFRLFPNLRINVAFSLYLSQETMSVEHFDDKNIGFWTMLMVELCLNPKISSAIP